MARRAIPVHRGWPILGVLPALQQDILDVLATAHRDQGDVVRLQLPGRAPVLSLAGPQQVRQVLQTNAANYGRSPFNDRLKTILGNGLLTADGEHWQRQRRLLQPSFALGEARRYVPIMVASARASADRIAKVDGPVDIEAETSRLALDIVLRTLFGSVTEQLDIMDAVESGRIEIADRFFSLVVLPAWIPTRRNRRFRKAKAALDAAVDAIVAAHAAAPAADGLLAAISPRDATVAPETHARQLRDEAMTILLAGHETTATGLAWCLYLLARDGAIRLALEEEARALPGQAWDDAALLDALPLGRAVVAEALRLHPPVPWFARRALGADEIDGYAIPKGAIIIVAPYLLHRDPRWWEAPERFEPTRFQGAAKPLPATYLPFGMGPRTCIGNHFALLEMTVALAVLVRAVRLDLVDQGAVRGHAMITLRPQPRLLMRRAA